MDVIATVWKKPYYHDRNQRMIDQGVDCFRIKCSHWGVKDIAKSLKQARQQIDQSGQPVKLLADLPEAKIRLGHFPQERVNISAGEKFHFKKAKKSPDPRTYVPLQLDNLSSYLKINDVFYLGDGELCFVVKEIINNNHLIAETQCAGKIVLKTGVTIPRVSDNLNHITPFIDEIINILPNTKPEMVAFSFVSSRSMMTTLKKKLYRVTTTEWQPLVIAKIESKKGVDNIDEILEVCDGIMVARGDLALTMPYAQLGMTQKTLVKKGREANKYVIVATQILKSLLNSYLPMRSDILDLTNIYLDGASAIMLCTETSHSKTPERAVEVAKEIINTLENKFR